MKLPEIKEELEVKVKNFPEPEKLSGLLTDLKKEISNIETNINVETDLKPVADIVGKIETWQKATIDAIRDIPEPKESKDYSENLKQIEKVVKDKDIDLSGLTVLLEKIASKEIEFDNSEVSAKLDKLDDLIKKVEKIKFEIPSKFVHKDNIKVSVDRVAGGGGGNSGGTVEVTNPFATEAKQDDIINALGKSFNTNEILEDGTDTYFCKETKTGIWWLMKIDTNSVFTHATNLNNGAVNSYADARTGYAGLTYQTYNLAFN